MAPEVDREAVRAYVEASRKAQGLPVAVEDEATLRRIAARLLQARVSSGPGADDEHSEES
jgi:hypothetical protein